MKKAVLCSVVLAIFSSPMVMAAQSIATRSKDVTSKDIPLKFELEKTTWDGDDISIWGKVKNSGEIKYRNVRVIFTAKDARGKFIGRTSWYVEPSDIESGQIGYIEKKFIECEGTRPALIEYSVIGET